MATLFDFIEDEEERKRLQALNAPAMEMFLGTQPAREPVAVDTTGREALGKRTNAQEYMEIMSAISGRGSEGSRLANSLRQITGRGGTYAPSSGTYGSALKNVMAIEDKELEAGIIDLQSRAGLTSLAEHRQWYTDMGLDPFYFDKARDAFRDYLTARQGEITSERAIGIEGERRRYAGNKEGRDKAFIEATSAIRARPLGPVTEPADIGAALNQMYSRLAVLGTKPGEVSNYGAAFEKIKALEEKRRKGEIDDAVAEISSDIMEKVAKGELKGSQALSQYDLRTQGYPSADRKAAREPLDSLIKQTEAELKEVDIGAKRKLEIAKLREDARLADLEEGKLIRAYNIASTLTKQVKDGKVLWQDANEIFKDRLQITGKDRRITDVREINALSTYFMAQIESEKPESITASALSRRAAEWGELASKKDGVIIPDNLATLNFQVRSLTTSAFMEKFPEAGPITGASLGVLLGRQIENILYMIPEDDREDVWNYYSANLVNAEERVGFKKATPSFAAVVDLDKADSVAAVLQKLELDSKTIIAIMRSLGFE